MTESVRDGGSMRAAVVDRLIGISDATIDA